jgi:hypothetical protein
MPLGGVTFPLSVGESTLVWKYSPRGRTATKDEVVQAGKPERLDE